MAYEIQREGIFLYEVDWRRDMRGFGRRLGLWALCICLLCLPVITAMATPAENCPGNCTHQAAIGTTHYDTLAEALTAATDGCTVMLLADISGITPLTVDKAITLDLGGKTISGQTTAEEALLTVKKNLILTNGTLTTDSGVALLVQDCALTVTSTASVQGGLNAMAIVAQGLNAKASVTVSGHASSLSNEPAVGLVSDTGAGCELSLDDTAIISAEGNAIEMYGAGKLKITGGTVSAKENAVVLDVYDNMTMEASVTGGTFTAVNADPFVVTSGINATVPADFVTGGTYNKVPTAYIPAYCRVLDNGNGTYTVISSFLITFQSGGAYGTMAPVTVRCGDSFTLPQCGFSSDANMDFAGWEIGGTTYAAGASFTPESNTVITAQWKSHVHYGGYATCLSPAVCTGCGSTYGQYGGHDLTVSGGYAATCDTPGMSEHSVCDTCGISFVGGVETSSFSLSTPALGHQWKTEKEKPATCTEAGSKAHRVCSLCGAVQVDGVDVEKTDVVIPALGHTMEAVEATQATCTQPGVQAHEHCTTCDQVFLQKKAVEPAQLTSTLSSHVLSAEWVSDEIYHWKACVDCQEVFRQSVHQDTDADSLCDDCGYQLPTAQVPAEEESSGFSFLFLIPIAAAVVIAVPLAIKKRK